jgi:hypothetical protein
VVTLGAEAGIPTPLTARLVTLIHEIERGARPQSLDTLDALADDKPSHKETRHEDTKTRSKTASDI